MGESFIICKGKLEVVPSILDHKERSGHPTSHAKAKKTSTSAMHSCSTKHNINVLIHVWNLYKRMYFLFNVEYMLYLDGKRRFEKEVGKP